MTCEAPEPDRPPAESAQSRAVDGGDPPPARLTATILPSLLAVVAVAAVIIALYVWHDERSSTLTVASDVRADSAAPAMQAPPATPSVPASASASASPSPAPSTPAPKVTTAPTNSSDRPPTKAAPRLPVVVLNQTRRTGLARRVAGQLRAQGWTVVQVGNFRGRVPATTVYYPRGAGAQAATLARTLPTPPRARPLFGSLAPNRLTVVLTDNYPQ